jgi:diadenosine tetraphosphate (Ap4A) HIT family hydrolase
MNAALADAPAFHLDTRLEADTMPVGDLALSAVLLLNDARFPWLVLVPRRPGAVELTDLAEADAAALMREARLAARVMLALAKPDKINIGALGNVVPQLHLHVIGRFRSDPAWPGPVWGFGRREPYPAHAAAALVERAAALFAAA